MRLRRNGYKVLRELITLSDGLCPLCGTEVDLEGVKKYVTWMAIRSPKPSQGRVRRKSINVNIDHIIPIALGGSNELTNLQLTHRECNLKKGCQLLTLDL